MGDSYLAINFKVSPISGRDILIAELSYLSFEMFEEKIEGVMAYIKKSAYKDGILNNVRIFNSNEFKISYKIQEIQNKNWNEQWEQNFDPVDINENCIIRAPFHKPSNKLYDIIIKPEMSFGTGHHETTQLMIEYLLEQNLENKRQRLGILIPYKWMSLLNRAHLGKIWTTDKTIPEIQKLGDFSII